MSMVPIKGFNGHPTLMYGSSQPVMMNTPCFSQFEPVVESASNLTYSINRSTSQCTLDAYLASGYFQGVIVVRFKVRALDRYTGSFYAGVSYIPPASSCGVMIKTYVSGSQVGPAVNIENPGGTYPISTYVTIPYYRYVILVDMVVTGNSEGGQGSLTISL